MPPMLRRLADSWLKVRKSTLAAWNCGQVKDAAGEHDGGGQQDAGAQQVAHHGFETAIVHRR